MNKTTYYYPKFVELQIMCRGPQMRPAGREFETPGLEDDKRLLPVSYSICDSC